MRNKQHDPMGLLPLKQPPKRKTKSFDNAEDAVARLKSLYCEATNFIYESFKAVMAGSKPQNRFRAYYPKISVTISSHGGQDSRLAFGHITRPGTYETTISRPDLYSRYLKTQIELILANHGGTVEVSVSDTPIPLHFAFPDGEHVEGSIEDRFKIPLRDVFDTPDLSVTDDNIVNGDYDVRPNVAQPLALFTAPRLDYSLHRLAHYTATNSKYFQNFVLFTNYQFYIDEFIEYARQQLADPQSGYDRFVEPGDRITKAGQPDINLGKEPKKMPQMPSYHLTRSDKSGITMINIGVGPSNAKTITDHVAVLRPHTWLMLGHCAGLRNSQSLGDYVLAHAYVREDSVLDGDLPVWVPIPALAEVQVAMEMAVAEVTGYSGYELKKVMRTGTVATIDNRNWELRDQEGPIKRLSQSRAIGLDMESATVAANGFRFRVPYGTLLCVSDKPLHGELKLPGMASDFYTRQVNQHLKIGIKALETLRTMPPERLHSRKLRAFNETAFQ